jgi:KDO II ethanolaminephosphotransferase
MRSRIIPAWHLLIGAISLYVALVFNGVVAVSRFSALRVEYRDAPELILLELILVLSFTAATFYLISIAGRTVFKGVVAVILILSAVSAYYMLFFKVVIGYGIIQATLSTDVEFSREIIGFGVIGFMLVFGILPAIWVIRFRLAENVLGSRLVMLVACVLSCLAAVSIYPFLLQNTGGKARPLTASPLGVVAHSYVPSNWLIGLAMSASNTYETVVRDQRLVNPADRFNYRASVDLQGTYLVVVIGESARYDRMGILGHSRRNTPELKQIKNLTAMRATSCNTSTRLSLQCMFVRPEAVKHDGVSGRQTISEETVFAVLKRLGFTSELFAMQGEVWFYNSIDADYYKHREVIYAEEANVGKPVDDLLLVPELQNSIERHPQGRHVVILHSKGSHYLYTSRYPRSYARYVPECTSSENPCDLEELLNSYDNSIAYTDHFLGQVIEKLKDRKAVMVYTSDHGESIGENAHLHGTPKDMAPPEQRMVPLVIWASNSFLLDPRNAARFSRLQAGKDRMAFHEYLFDSILGCLGIESDNGGINQERNLCREN